VNEENKTDRRPFSTAGERLDDFLDDASTRIEKETQQLLTYINDELVPAIRDHSSKALRAASEKLKQAADMMEEQQRRKKA
jgi:phytoene dehydrogenase-like protein